MRNFIQEQIKNSYITMQSVYGNELLIDMIEKIGKTICTVLQERQ